MIQVFLLALVALALGFAAGHVLARSTARRQQSQTDEMHTRLLEQEKGNSALALKREQANHTQQLAEAKATYEQSLQAMKVQFAQTAEEAMKRRASELKEANREQLALLMKPVADGLASMQHTMHQASVATAERHTKMGETIANLLLHTQKVEQNADSLARALQGNSKMQGDWGEQLLASILEESGLRLGHEFDVQLNVKDEDGHNLRPDVVVHCPQNRHIIIDSKVSLTAYLRYTAAQTPEEAQTAQRDNLTSVRAHIDELAAKQYHKLVKGALPHVLMFIPNEGSYILAFRADTQLGQYAYRKGIILINPTNLMLALQMIFNLWQTERQNRNTEKVMKQAADLYDKFVVFAGKFQKIQIAIDNLKKASDDAYGSLVSGKANIVHRLEQICQLGVTPSKSIPDGMKSDDIPDLSTEPESNDNE